MVARMTSRAGAAPVALAVLPWIGAFFSKDDNAYHYLPASVLQFPSPAAFSRLMSDAGFSDVRFKSMTLGIVTLFVASRQ